MPSRESVSDEIRARTEFAAAVRNGIEVLMGRCGYSRERATLALLKELNRGNGPDCKPMDEEIFDAMKKYKLGLDEANRAIVVGRAMRRELLFRGENNSRKTTPLEAIQKLTSKLSLDNILYESGEDDSDDDGQSEILPLKIPKTSRVPSSSSLNRSSSTSSTDSISTSHSSTSSRKTARSKKITLASPRKQLKSSLRNKGNSSSNSNKNRKRSIEDMDGTKQNAEVDVKSTSSRPQLRASKRLHRSAAPTDTSVSSGLASKK